MRSGQGSRRDRGGGTDEVPDELDGGAFGGVGADFLGEAVGGVERP